MSDRVQAERVRDHPRATPAQQDAARTYLEAMPAVKPLLTIITPTYKRPLGLQMCRASVAAQQDAELIQHLIIHDPVGRGVGGMYADLSNHHHRIEGEYVFILSDDDVLIFPRVIPLLKVIIQQHDPDVVMVKQFYQDRILPAPDCWGGPPACGFVTLSNWIVRASIHREIPYGARYEGDYDFIAAVWRVQPKIAWADVVLSATQEGAHFGRAE